MRRNPPILLLRLGEGAAPSISFPSIQLRFAGLAEASPVFSPSSTKRSGRYCSTDRQTSKSLPLTVFFQPVKRHARRPRATSAEQLLRAGLFLKNPDWPRGFTRT